MQLATGQNPYQQVGTLSSLFRHIVYEPSPSLPAGGPYSAEFRDFVAQWYVLSPVFHISVVLCHCALDIYK